MGRTRALVGEGLGLGVAEIGGEGMVGGCGCGHVGVKGVRVWVSGVWACECGGWG